MFVVLSLMVKDVGYSNDLLTGHYSVHSLRCFCKVNFKCGLNCTNGNLVFDQITRIRNCAIEAILFWLRLIISRYYFNLQLERQSIVYSIVNL